MRRRDLPAPGTRVRFRDSGNVVQRADVAVGSGIVNGEPIDDGAGGIRYVPVYAARDNGRESTTIYVAETNLLVDVDTAAGDE